MGIGAIGVSLENICYAILDLLSKIVFSFLMLGISPYESVSDPLLRQKKEDESESDEACCPSCVRWGFVRLLLARLAVSVSVSLSLFTFINVGSLWSRATSVSVSLSLFTFVLLSLSLCLVVLVHMNPSAS